MRRQAGQLAFLSVSTGTASPDEAPQATVYSADGTAVVSDIKLPPLGDDNVFGRAWRVSIAAGDYLVRYLWEVSSVEKVRTEPLKVLPGGDAEGAYRNLTFYEPPHARFVVGQQESDKDTFRRNPRV